MIVFSFSRKECEANAVALKKMDVTDDDEKRLIDEVPWNSQLKIYGILCLYIYIHVLLILHDLYGKSKHIYVYIYYIYIYTHLDFRGMDVCFFLNTLVALRLDNSCEARQRWSSSIDFQCTGYSNSGFSPRGYPP